MDKIKDFTNTINQIFEDVEMFKDEVPLKRVILIIIFCLLIAGLIEGHITQKILNTLL